MTGVRSVGADYSSQLLLKRRDLEFLNCGFVWPPSGSEAQAGARRTANVTCYFKGLCYSCAGLWCGTLVRRTHCSGRDYAQLLQ